MSAARSSRASRSSPVLILLVALLLALAAPARADELVAQFPGTVTALVAGPALTEDFAALGVEVGAPLSVSFTLDTAVPGAPSSAGPEYTVYELAIRALEITIGDWVIAYQDPGAPHSNLVQVGNDVPVPPSFVSDSYTLGTLMELEPTPVFTPALGPFDVIVCNLVFADGDGKALTNGGLVQDFSRFDFGSGAVGGVPGQIAFLLDLGPGGGPGDPTALARHGQLKAASKFAGAVLKAEAAAAAKPPGADPGGVQLAAALSKAEDTFAQQFLAAVAKALAKGGSAPLPGSAWPELSAGVLADLGALADDVLLGLDPEDKLDRVLRSKLLKAAGRFASKALSAHAADAKKPAPDKLAARLEKARAALLKSAQKALDVAAKKGVEYLGPSPAELLAVLEPFVHGVVAQTLP